MRFASSRIVAVALASFALSVASSSSPSFGQAADATAASPAGTWTWTQPGRNGDQQNSLTLKQDGDKLTGTLSANGRDSEISDATFKDGTLTFKVTRDFNGQQMVTTYTGTVSGDTYKAKSEQVTTREITATRAK